MTTGDAQALAEHYLAGVLPQRWQHVQAVAAEVIRLSQALEVDDDALVAAGWLHFPRKSPCCR